MTIAEIIYKHLLEYNYVIRKGLINKIILLAIISAFLFNNFFDFLKHLYDNHMDQFEGWIIFTSFFGTLLFGLMIFIKPRSFAPSSGLKKSKLYFKDDVFNFIREHNPEMQEIMPFQKIHFQSLLNSGFIPKKDFNYEGDDCMSGSYNNIPFKLCEVNLFRYYKSFFYGQFTICDVNRPVPPAFITFKHQDLDYSGSVISANTVRMIQDYCSKYNSEIKISLKEQKLYIAIGRHRNLFENHNKKAIGNLGSDYDIFVANFSIIKSIIDDLR